MTAGCRRQPQPGTRRHLAGSLDCLGTISLRPLQPSARIGARPASGRQWQEIQRREAFSAETTEGFEHVRRSTGKAPGRFQAPQGRGQGLQGGARRGAARDPTGACWRPTSTSASSRASSPHPRTRRGREGPRQPDSGAAGDQDRQGRAGSLLGEEGQEIQISGSPSVTMLCGLQGSGKTTTAGKLALRSQGAGTPPATGGGRPAARRGGRAAGAGGRPGRRAGDHAEDRRGRARRRPSAR